jgi:hypothetical protein
VTRVVLATLLSRRWRQDAQVARLMAHAVAHGLDVVAIARCDPGAAVAAVRVGTVDAVLVVGPDPAGLLARSGVRVVYLCPPAQRKPDGRPLAERRLAGVGGWRLLGALERTAGDTALVALVFGLPLDVVERFDAERRQRAAVAA